MKDRQIAVGNPRCKETTLARLTAKYTESKAQLTDTIDRIRSEYWQKVTSDIISAFGNNDIAHAYALVNEVHNQFQIGTVG